jgi:iron-sulfur cluster assembly accessory protein|tara:strand:+ start:6352 stop:6663 length:312 start_codon:yes stop_codon:yes gene_type:complete
MKIEITNVALEKLLHKGVTTVRLGVTKGGCAGYEYIFTEDTEKEGDHSQYFGNLWIVIDEVSQPFLDGMTLDYIKTGLNESFEFINPNEQQSCGCGVSVQFSA